MNKNITSYNDKEQRHGLWEIYWSNGDVYYKCFYVNGIITGYQESKTICGDDVILTFAI